ncbi:hypothetical protein IWZ00DRAFT_312918 [Phyllosticta capitalensis]
MAVQGPHLTLQSRCEGCDIIPPELDPNLVAEMRGKISLERSTRDCQYNVVLRPNDRIFLWSNEDSYKCSFKVLPEDVQVASSIPATQGKRAAKHEQPQQTLSQPDKNYRARPEMSWSPEEARGIQTESTERRTHEQIPAATPIAGSTGTSQIVKDTPATDRFRDTSLQNVRYTPRAQSGPGSHSMEDANRRQGHRSALSHSASMTTIDPRYLSRQDPEDPEEDDEDATASEGPDEEDDEEDLDAVKSPKPASESSHANGTSKLRSASHEQAEETGAPEDSYDKEEEDGPRNVRERPRRRLPSPQQQYRSPRVVIPVNPPSSGEHKRKASEEISPRPAKRGVLAEEADYLFPDVPSPKPRAVYGRGARMRAANASKDVSRSPRSSNLSRQSSTNEGRPKDDSRSPRSSNRSRQSLTNEGPPKDESRSPRSSNRSPQSSINKGPEIAKDTPIRVVFSNSNVVTRLSPMKFLGKRGVQVLDSVSSNGFDFLCVKSTEPMKKSFKLLMSVISSKRIISDDWVTESHKAHKLLDTKEFIATNAPKEWGWGSSQDEVTEALELDRSKLFEGFEVVITPSLKKEYGKGYKDVEKLLGATGAYKVSAKGARAEGFGDDTIVIGSETADPADPDATKLTANNIRCFNKDFISMSILRGEQLDLDSDEFLLQFDTPKKTGKVGRPKKSK